MGRKIYCKKCKKDFVVYHNNLELIAIRPDLESEFGCEYRDRIYSCPRCDTVFIHAEYID